MNKMAEYRKKAGLTQTQLAEYLGISQNTLSQYETGKRNPDIKTVEMMADYFSTSINGILGIKDPPADSSGDKPALWTIRKISVANGVEDCNILLAAGWKLLHIGEDRTNYDDGSCSSTVVYTLGWTGDPKDTKAITSLSPSSERQYNEWGWDDD